jgi:hypothetical protein
MSTLNIPSEFLDADIDLHSEVSDITSDIEDINIDINNIASENQLNNDTNYKDINYKEGNYKEGNEKQALTPQQQFTYTFKIIKKIIKKFITKLEQIKSKKQKIKTVIEEISKNKKLYFKDHVDNLNFQIEILANEYNYLNNMGYSVINKYLHDLIINGQHIIFLLTSLLNYNINDNKNEILSKIKKIDIQIDNKKPLNDILTQIDTVISNTNHNITLINDFNKEYNEFIEKLTNKFEYENLHCNNLATSYTFKKKQFDLEYDKNISTLYNIHEYFNNLAITLNNQIAQTIVCDFCLESKM